MKPYGNQLNLKKKVSYESKKNSEKISIINIKSEILIVSKILCINLILIMDIFSEFFLLSYETFFFKLS